MVTSISAPPLEVIYVKHVGTGADVGHEGSSYPTGHHLRHGVLGILQITEQSGRADTGLDTGRLEPLFNPMIAEGAFVHARAGAPVSGPIKLLAHPYIRIGDGYAGMIGAGHGAGTAAHAEFLVDHDDAIRLLISSSSGANAHAGRVITVVTEAREEAAMHIVTYPDLLVVDIGAPLVIIPHRGLVL